MRDEDLKQLKSDILYHRPYGYKIPLTDKQLEELFYLGINLLKQPRYEDGTHWNTSAVVGKILRFMENNKLKGE